MTEPIAVPPAAAAIIQKLADRRAAIEQEFVAAIAMARACVGASEAAQLRVKDNVMEFAEQAEMPKTGE